MQTCKECGKEFDSFMINDYCSECEENFSQLNKKIYYQLEREFNGIIEEVVKKPEFFSVKIKPDIKKLEVKIYMNALNEYKKEQMGYKEGMVLKIERDKDEFEIKGEYLTEFEEKILDHRKKEEYRKKPS